jgi:hypothetical protein
MDFTINGFAMGTKNGELQLSRPGIVEVSVKAAAYLDSVPNEALSKLPYDKQPYWEIERARIGATRKVPVEVIWNGRCVASQELLSDGSSQMLRFSVPIEESGWMALRILPSSHTNPLLVTVGGKQMQPSKPSAEWCLAAVDQCWSQKSPQISGSEIVAARQAYEHARQTYRNLLR